MKKAPLWKCSLPAFFVAVFVLPVLSAPCYTAEQENRNTDEAIKSLINKEYPELEKIYKHLHSHPELSLQEKETSALVAREFRAAGYDVTENVGGYGVVGVMRNGEGPTVLLRGDMDALPITEKTGLPYASKVKAIDRKGREVGVMHACGHDIHTTVLIGNARVLAKMKDKWRGTLVLVAQPAEEGFEGASSMFKDGLYTRFPHPDYAFALHVDPKYPAGVVAVREGQALAGTENVEVTVRGMGGHGSSPHEAIDPVVLAARMILALQTVISRELDQREPAVLTIGQIHGGTAPNIIPTEVRFTINLRFTSDEIYEQMMEAIKRQCRGIAVSAGLPESLMPVIKASGNPNPSVYNDPELTRLVVDAFGKILGAENVVRSELFMASEDFALFRYGEPPVKIVLFWLGINDPEFLRSVEGKKLSELDEKTAGRLALHTPYICSLPEPSIKTGVKAFCVTVLDLMK